MIKPKNVEDRVEVIEYDDYTELYVDGEFFDDSRPLRTEGPSHDPRAPQDMIDISREIMNLTSLDIIKIINTTVDMCYNKVKNCHSNHCQSKFVSMRMVLASICELETKKQRFTEKHKCVQCCFCKADLLNTTRWSVVVQELNTMGVCSAAMERQHQRHVCNLCMAKIKDTMNKLDGE